MSVFPLAAAAVAFVFGAVLLQRFLQRGRPFLGLWAVALFMYSAASVALFLGALNGWTTGEFRVYWLLGAVLNVPFLAMGELYLLIANRWVNLVLLVLLLAGTVIAMATVRTAPIHQAALAKEMPLGRDYYTYPAYFLLLGGILWSALHMRGIPELRDRFYGTLLIGAGATIVAVGTGVGAGVAKSFVVVSLGLLAGIVVMFLGFLRTTRRPQPAPSEPRA